MAAILTRPQCVNTKSLLQMRCISITKGLQICLYCLILKLMFGPSYNLDRIQLQFQIDCLHWLCGWRHVSCVWLLTGYWDCTLWWDAMRAPSGLHSCMMQSHLSVVHFIDEPFHYYTPCTKKLLGGILVSLHPTIHLSVRPSIPHLVSAL